jgi:hypothetical protein
VLKYSFHIGVSRYALEGSDCGNCIHFRYEPPIETPAEMADRNVKWGGMDIAYVFFLQESLDPKMKKLATNFIAGTEEYLTQRAATGDIGFVIERMQ